MTLLEGVTVAMAGVGVLFMIAGTVGLLRFPDVHCRLHALTKADNLGLGFIVLALMPHAGLSDVLKLLVVWLLAVLAAATATQLIARAALVEAPPLRSEGP